MAHPEYLAGVSEIVAPENVFTLLTVFAIGVIYWLHESIVVPWSIKRHQRLLIFGEYSRNQYYHQWVHRVRSTLESLLRDSINIYESIYGKEYSKKSTEYVREYVDGLIVGVTPKPMCDLVHECMAKTMDATKENLIDFDRWGKCESGIGVEECEIFRERKALPPLAS